MITFHDPCYLGRHNGIVEEPRQALLSTNAFMVEMPRHGKQSFCCGAGGAQMWKEEEHGTAAVNVTRYEEAAATGAKTIAVGCPFCLTMMTDASKEAGKGIKVKDVAEIIAERLVVAEQAVGRCAAAARDQRSLDAKYPCALKRGVLGVFVWLARPCLAGAAGHGARRDWRRGEPGTLVGRWRYGPGGAGCLGRTFPARGA